MVETELSPVLLIPGIASSGLEIKKSALGKEYEGHRVWMNPAMLAAGCLLQDEAISKENICERSAPTGDDDDDKKPRQVITSREASLEIRSPWVFHMSLCSDMVTERPGNEVRIYEGLEGCEYVTGDKLTQIGSHVLAPIVDCLVGDLGYVREKNIDAAPYDWRLPPRATEDRDGYLTGVKEKIERLSRDNHDLPVVLICHSMGCKMGHYFLNFAKMNYGQEWLDRYIRSYIPIGGVHCGVAPAVRAGVVGSGLAAPVDTMMEGEDEGVLLHRSWGSGIWLMPRVLPPHVFPSVICRREGELAVVLSGPISLEGLVPENREDPAELRLGVSFGKDLKIMSSYRTASDDNTSIRFDEESFYFAVPEVTEDDQVLGTLSFFLEEPGGKFKDLLNDGKDDEKRGWFEGLVDSATDAIVDAGKEWAKKVGYGSYVGQSQEMELRASDFGGNEDDEPIAREFAMSHPRHHVVTDRFTVHLKHVRRRIPTNECDAPIAGIADEAIGAAPLKVPKKQGAAANFDYLSGHQIFAIEGFNDAVGVAGGEYYDSDPVGPRTTSSTEVPPVRSVHAIYGTNIETKVSSVYRHRPAFIVGDDKADSRFVIDTDVELDGRAAHNNRDPWQWHNYKFEKGEISETKETHQRTLDTKTGKEVMVKTCGDGTVPYWNLAHAKTWKNDLEEFSVHELDGAEHRGIVSDARCHDLLKEFVTLKKDDETKKKIKEMMERGKHK